MDPNQHLASGATLNPTRPLTENHSIRNVMQELYRDMSTLFDRQGQLLRAELSEKATIVKASGAAMVSAVVMIVFGVQALVATAIIALSYAVDLWLAAAIVSGVLLIGGVLIALKAMKSLNFENLKPKKSADALSDIGSK
ncbi:MAG: phage holin family protein, partial [Proteobacteria bacterium]